MAKSVKAFTLKIEQIEKLSKMKNTHNNTTHIARKKELNQWVTAVGKKQSAC